MGDTSKRAPLSRAAIVDSAIELADQDGVAALTMRNLAGRLGYKVMALYNHVDNKDQLLCLMVDAVAAEVDEASADVDAIAAVRAMAMSTRAALVRHPWAAELWQRYLPGTARTLHMENLLRTLDRSGLSADLAHHGFHAVNNHVLGYTLQELGMTLDKGDPEDVAALGEDFLSGMPVETYPHTVAHVRQHLDGDTASSFELVLDLILDGLVGLESRR